jgi:hypothetical protein
VRLTSRRLAALLSVIAIAGVVMGGWLVWDVFFAAAY